MKYNDVPQLDCQVGENNWLDVVYVQKKYNKSTKGAKKSAAVKKRGRRGFYVAVACVIIAGALLGLAFIDSGFVGGIFQSAMETFTTGIFAPKQQTIQMPTNAEVYSCINGDIVIGGSSVVLNISKGVVKSIDAETGKVVVSINEKYDVVYGGVTEIMVTEGQSLEKYALIGRYTETAVINILKEGAKVSQVSCQDYKIVWGT